MSLMDETLRLLGCKGEIDERLLNDVGRVMDELISVAAFRYVSAVFPAAVGKDSVAIEGLTFNSVSLAKHLFGCDEIILFAATLGSAVDRLMRRMSAMNMEYAAILQAASAALLEESCDALEETLLCKRHGMSLTPRFSPGYGGLSLEYQSPILNRLDAGRKLGLGVTEGLMLSPTKSITAVIGISQKPMITRHTCANCDKADCVARRDNI